MPRPSSNSRPKKQGRPQDWSEDELKLLKAMARQKVDAREMAIALGRHIGSVKRKLRELGWVPRKG
jgi:transposase